MEQLHFFDPVDKSKPGAVWWSGGHQCRNWHSYYQTREGGIGPWQFIIHAFGDHDAVVYCLNDTGKLYHWRVFMDDKDRLLIDGKAYGPKNWHH